MTKSRRVRQSEVAPYSPANHTGTRNYRLIGPETVGAKQVEVLVGEIERGKGALPHAHPGIERPMSPLALDDLASPADSICSKMSPS